MDTDIAWEECLADLPLDTKDLPPLNALSSSTSSQLPDIDLLELLTFEPNSDSVTSPEPTINPNLSPLCHTPPKSNFPNATAFTTSPPTSIFSDELSPLDTSSKSLSQSSAINGPTPLTTPSLTSSPPSSPSPTPSHTHASEKSRVDTGTASASKQQCAGAPLTDQSQLILEMSTRLASACAEATSLRKRIASLTSENRSLRCALDHANARLIAVAQAASAPPVPPAGPPVVVGLAHMTSDAAARVAGALTVSDTSADGGPRERKKRRRVTGAATTMACVMFMWGALMGTPGWLSSSSSSSRSQGNLPAVWHGKSGLSNVPVPSLPRSEAMRDAWQPNCMRMLEQLPDGSDTSSLSKDVKEEPMVIESVETKGNVIRDVEMEDEDALMTDNKMTVDVAEDKAAANVVARSDLDDPRHPRYSYVLCRDAQSAMDNLKACTSKMRRGEACGEPHTISLILPADVAGLDDDNQTRGDQPALAEVLCSITSVARIPVESSTESQSSLGSIVATVPETATVIADH